MLNKRQKEKVLELFSGSYYSDNEALKLAEKVRKAVSEKNGKILCRVDHVAQSGMSRHISVAIISNGELINLNGTPFRKIFADRNRIEKSGGVYISGCGMDMLFEASYRLFRFFYPYNNQRKNGYRQPKKYLNRYDRF